MSITQKNKEILEKKRTSQIQTAALALFWKNGYGNTTMDEIAKKAKISKGLIYHYYKNKTEILFSFEGKYNACIEELEQLPSEKERIREYGKRFLQSEVDPSGYIPPLQVFAIAFAKGEVDPALHKEKNPLYQDLGRTYFAPLFEKAMKKGEIKQGDPLIFGNIYWHFLLGNIIEVMHGINHNNYDRSKAVDDMIAIFEP